MTILVQVLESLYSLPSKDSPNLRRFWISLNSRTSLGLSHSATIVIDSNLPYRHQSQRALAELANHSSSSRSSSSSDNLSSRMRLAWPCFSKPLNFWESWVGSRRLSRLWCQMRSLHSRWTCLHVRRRDRERATSMVQGERDTAPEREARQ